MINFSENKYRVRRSINSNNRIIASEHGVRQVLFPYVTLSYLVYKNVSIGQKSREEIDNLFNALMQKAFKGELII